MTSLKYYPDLPSYTIELQANLRHEHHLLQDALGYCFPSSYLHVQLFYRRGLTDDLGAEALMIEALDKVEKDLKKPLVRNDKKGMDLLLAEFDKINKK